MKILCACITLFLCYAHLLDGKPLQEGSAFKNKYCSRNQTVNPSDVNKLINSGGGSKTDIAIYDPSVMMNDKLQHAPAALRILGKICLLAADRDFSLIAKYQDQTKFVYQHMKYPDSFRASLMQVVHESYWAFNEAHTAMHEIKLETDHVPGYLRNSLGILFKGDTWDVKHHLPNSLKMISDTAASCMNRAKDVVKRFKKTMKLIMEVKNCMLCRDKDYESFKQEEETRIRVANQTLTHLNAQKERLDDMKSTIQDELVKASQQYDKALDDMPSNGMVIWSTFVKGLVGIGMEAVRKEPVAPGEASTASVDNKLIDSIWDLHRSLEIMINDLYKKDRDDPKVKARQAVNIMKPKVKKFLVDFDSANADLQALLDAKGPMAHNVTGRLRRRGYQLESVYTSSDNGTSSQGNKTSDDSFNGFEYAKDVMGNGTFETEFPDNNGTEVLTKIAMAPVKEDISPRVDDPSTRLTDVTRLSMVKILKSLTSYSEGFIHDINQLKGSMSQPVDSLKDLVEVTIPLIRGTNINARDSPAEAKTMRYAEREERDDMLRNAHTKLRLTQAQLDIARKRREKNFQDIMDKETELTKKMIDLTNFKANVANFEDILKILSKAVVVMTELTQKWTELLEYFQHISAQIEIAMGKPLNEFVSYSKLEVNKTLEMGKVSTSERMRGIIFQCSMTAYRTSYQVNYMADNYHSLSTTYMMPMVSGLGILMAVDPERHPERVNSLEQKLESQAENFTQGIKDMLKASKDDYERKVEERLADMEQMQQCLTPLPAKEVKKIEDKINKSQAYVAPAPASAPTPAPASAPTPAPATDDYFDL